MEKIASFLRDEICVAGGLAADFVIVADMRAEWHLCRSALLCAWKNMALQGKQQFAGAGKMF
jgi:hypothetical protein